MRVLITGLPGKQLRSVCAIFLSLVSAADVSYAVDVVEWGRGQGPSRGAAMEAAAKNVLIAKGVLPKET